MVIRINLRALRQTRWHELLVRFVLGGLITAITGWITSRFGPVVGGVFLAFPVIFPATATLLEKHQQEKKRRAGIACTIRGRLAAALDARGAIMGTLGAMAFAAITWKLLPRGNVGVVLFCALVGWFAVSSALWYVRKHHPWSRPKHRG